MCCTSRCGAGPAPYDLLHLPASFRRQLDADKSGTTRHHYLLPRHDGHGRMPPYCGGIDHPRSSACRVPRHRHQRGQATLEDMSAPSQRLKDLVEATVDHHASLTHPDLQEVTIRWRGSFGYLSSPGLARATMTTSRSRSAASNTSATRTTGASRSTTTPPRPTPRPCWVPASPPNTLNNVIDTAALTHLADYQQ